MKKYLLIGLLSISSWAAAGDIEFTEPLTQQEFKEFVKEFGKTIQFNPLTPAEPLGMLGFDLSVDTVLADISEDKAFWRKMVSDNDPASIAVVPRIHVQKGLPFKLDIGAMYGLMPDSNVEIWGVEVKYALLEGTPVTPAVSLRGSYSLLQGVDDVDLETVGLDAMISKGFLMVTPYAGASVLGLRGWENSHQVNLSRVTEADFKTFAGIQVSPFPFFTVSGEVTFGEMRQFGLKLGVRF